MQFSTIFTIAVAAFITGSQAAPAASHLPIAPRNPLRIATHVDNPLYPTANPTIAARGATGAAGFATQAPFAKRAATAVPVPTGF